MFYLIIIRFIPFFYKKEILDQSHKLSFSPLKFLGLEKFPFFSFSFPHFLSFLSLLFYSTSRNEFARTAGAHEAAQGPSLLP
jgi:hypothetical protein